ncbi:MAG: flagellar hook-associated protein FlgK, partial [Deltaproteobacteria bacterium]|nr:flagellar hook-associated protein FlgK [Deltaproteobacteria bacterium]
MSDLLAILSRGATSLGAHRAAAATTSHNLENVDTPGYSRQRAELAAELPAEVAARAFIGRGVSLEAVSQARDRFLEAQIPGAYALSAQADAESQALSSVHALDPELANGIGAGLSGYFSALRALSQNPGNAVQRRAAVDAARNLAATFPRTASSLDEARTGLDQ